MARKIRERSAQAALLTCYERIGRLSRLMVEAAENGDWNTLADAEAVCEQVIRRMRAIGNPQLALDAAAQRRRLEILRGMLSDDARIREITQPWVLQVAPYVGTSARRGRGS